MKVDTQDSDDIYFVAPDKYLGDKRSAYTYALSFHLQQDNASSPATSSRGDVILEGKWFDEPLVSSLDAAPPGGENFRKYEVSFQQLCLTIITHSNNGNEKDDDDGDRTIVGVIIIISITIVHIIVIIVELLFLDQSLPVEIFFDPGEFGPRDLGFSFPGVDDNHQTVILCI